MPESPTFGGNSVVLPEDEADPGMYIYEQTNKTHYKKWCIV